MPTKHQEKTHAHHDDSVHATIAGVVLKYIGTTDIRVGERPIVPGEEISGPPDVVADLAKRGDFEKVKG